MTAPATGAPPGGAFAVGLRTDRHSKHLIILPAVFILLFIGVFPLVYTLVASVQNITMLEEGTSFHGLLHYRHLFEDVRLWESIGHPLLITGIALPIELGLGLLMAFLVGHQARLRLSGDLHRRDLAVDAVHVPADVGSGRPVRSTPRPLPLRPSLIA